MEASKAHTSPDHAPSRQPSWVLSGVPQGVEPLVLSTILAGKMDGLPQPEMIIHIAVNGRNIDATAAALQFFSPEIDVLRFPAWDVMPYDRASPQPGIMAERMRTLAALATRASDKPAVILTTANAIVQRLPPRSAMHGAAFSLKKNQNLKQDALIAYLLSQGYRRAGKAMEAGEFAVRGSLLDVIPSGAERGMRIDWLDDEVETIRPFDPLSQVTSGTVEEVMLYPVSEVMLTPDNVERFRARYRELFGAVNKSDVLYEAISQQGAAPGMEHFLPLFYDKLDSLFDYCPDALVTLSYEAESAIAERQETILDYYGARASALQATGKKNSFGAGGVAYHPVPTDQFFIGAASWELLLGRQPHAVFSPFVGEGSDDDASFVYINYRSSPRFKTGEQNPFEQLREAMDVASAKGKKTLLACYSDGTRERLTGLLLERAKEQHFHPVRVERWAERTKLSGKAIGLLALPLEHGFETAEFILFTEQDVFGERAQKSRKPKKMSDVFMAEAANLSEGELVVHREHGIGKFSGLTTLTISGAAHDCLTIIYDGDDKLFLPVENADMVSRYGMEDENVKLDKLGGASWQARKAKLKQRIKIAAEALLKTAAERLVKSGEIVAPQQELYEEFCNRFTFVETEDQAKAIDDVMADLASGKPMDRLICGDVGFGKTEVALRAAFAAALSDNERRQVAVITPTTLLARQHFRNFRGRFEGFPVKVRQLSRMVPTREQKETREQLAEGAVDIVIGTHALLSKQTQFKDLGLVIIDEEQHFGVAQKEKLKELKSDVHVLTLSATPIPRTLQMALTGVRDLSLITTPPVDRLAIRSFVMPLDPVVLREALLREQHRGGRSFVVTPRIKDIAELKLKLADLVPELRVAVAHGQMAPSDLDKIMNEFYDGSYDILLSTAIIESGLDIPTANTMIIHNSHLFGLSQLYQMRGRVGRGKTRAYAYFLLPPSYKNLTTNATKRLEVMQTLDTLGAGFTLASHDMDIRGFGNLVGEEQSGHIREVGVELYQQMLEEAVAALRKKPANEKAQQLLETDSVSDSAEDDWSPTINLGISVLIPEDYVSDLSLRLGLYRRVSKMEDDNEISHFAAELVDRFGPMPEETQHLISILKLKLLCKRAHIERLDIGPKGAVLGFYQSEFPKPLDLLRHIERNPRSFKLRPDQKLIFTHEWKENEDKVFVIKDLLDSIIRLL